MCQGDTYEAGEHFGVRGVRKRAITEVAGWVSRLGKIPKLTGNAATAD